MSNKKKTPTTSELNFGSDEYSTEKEEERTVQEHDDSARTTMPSFKDLLENPKSDSELPKNFSPSDEAAHLIELWGQHKNLQKYIFNEFISAGGSGMVFKVTRKGSQRNLALKVSRQRLSKVSNNDKVANSLSPVSESELKALDELSHPNIVRLYDAIEGTKGVFAVCTSFVEDPQNLDEYVKSRLKEEPEKTIVSRSGLVSSQRLEGACHFILLRLTETASALKHMHEKGIYHFDVKPANILVSRSSKLKESYLTDMGSCIHWSDIPQGSSSQRVHFSWPYAHPYLRDLSRDPSDISGGGLSASANIPADEERPGRFDLFALGKTLQEILGILDTEFKERTHSSYLYRFLHLTACLLLDGELSSAHDTSVTKDGRYFVADVALNCPKELFARHRILSTSALYQQLERFMGEYALTSLAPEFNRWQPDVINLSTEYRAPFTSRIRAIFNHPCVRRLKTSQQLGWMREIFPGATHDRWAHSVGVLSSLVCGYEALLSDHELPTSGCLLTNLLLRMQWRQP